MWADDDEVLALVRRHWSPEVDRVARLPGVGAQWQALVGLRPTLFVTLDADPAVEAVHAAVAELAFGLDSVVAGLPTTSLSYTVPVAGGALGVAPWVHGDPAEDDDAATLALLARLHAVRPPRGLPRWTPLDLDHPRHRHLCEVAVTRDWVTTHGSPTARHQLDTPVRRLLVGWARARLAPRERDLVHVPGPHPDADPEMLELFDLERRLEGTTSVNP